MARAKHSIGRGFLFVGNHPCLDFVNTQCRPHEETVDLLPGFVNLIAWLRTAQLIDQTQARQALAKWSPPRRANHALEQAREFRAALRQMAEALSDGRSAPPKSIAAINQLVARARWSVTPAGRGFERRLVLDLSKPRALLVPVAVAAMDLLCNHDLSRIRRCKNPQCVGFFYDSSKNRQRRWCSMAVCGNRAKVAAYYHRQRRIARGTAGGGNAVTGKPPRRRECSP